MRAVLAAELPFAANHLSVDEAGHFGREARRLLGACDEVGDLKLEDFLAGVAEHLEAGGYLHRSRVADEDAGRRPVRQGGEPALAVERLLTAVFRSWKTSTTPITLPAASKMGAALFDDLASIPL